MTPTATYYSAHLFGRAPVVRLQMLHESSFVLYSKPRKNFLSLCRVASPAYGAQYKDADDMSGIGSRVWEGGPDDEGNEVVVECDANGCNIILRPDRSHAKAAEAFNTSIAPGFQVYSGPGWKLGLEKVTEGNYLCAMAGGDNWSTDLTLDEFHEFGKALLKVRRKVKALVYSGQWGPDAHPIELCTAHVWLQGTPPTASQVTDLPQSAFGLRIIVRSPGQREFSGAWMPDAVVNMLDVLDQQDAHAPDSLVPSKYF